MAPPQSIRVELGASRLAAAFILTTHLATAFLVAWLPGSAALRAAVVIAVGAHALWALRQSAGRSLRSSIVGVELGADRHVTLLRRDGGRIEGSVRAESYVGERLVTLVVRRSGSWRSCTLWLLPDMTVPEEVRAFRVLLRMGRAEERAKP